MNHPTITAFWQVVSGFDEEQKRSLLKFVTSCSRPPLLGFKVIFICLIFFMHKIISQDLDPPFCIQNAGVEQERLPTASTCMNLLKLPDFRVRIIIFGLFTFWELENRQASVSIHKIIGIQSINLKQPNWL